MDSARFESFCSFLVLQAWAQSKFILCPKREMFKEERQRISDGMKEKFAYFLQKENIDPISGKGIREAVAYMPLYSVFGVHERYILETIYEQIPEPCAQLEAMFAFTVNRRRNVFDAILPFLAKHGSSVFSPKKMKAEYNKLDAQLRGMQADGYGLSTEKGTYLHVPRFTEDEKNCKPIILRYDTGQEALADIKFNKDGFIGALAENGRAKNAGFSQRFHLTKVHCRCSDAPIAHDRQSFLELCKENYDKPCGVALREKSNFVKWLIRRMSEFAELGREVYHYMEANKDLHAMHICKFIAAKNKERHLGCGDYFEKIFTISLHLRFPERRLASNESQVGSTNAANALKLIYPYMGGLSAKDAHSELLRDKLMPELHAREDFRRTAELSHKTAIEYSMKNNKSYLRRAIEVLDSQRLEAGDVQVNLCEWLKFERCNAQRLGKRDAQLVQKTMKSEESSSSVEPLEPTGTKITGKRLKKLSLVAGKHEPEWGGRTARPSLSSRVTKLPKVIPAGKTAYSRKRLPKVPTEPFSQDLSEDTPRAAPPTRRLGRTTASSRTVRRSTLLRAVNSVAKSSCSRAVRALGQSLPCRRAVGSRTPSSASSPFIPPEKPGSAPILHPLRTARRGRRKCESSPPVLHPSSEKREEDEGTCREKSRSKVGRPKAGMKVVRRKALAQLMPTAEGATAEDVPKAPSSPAASRSRSGSRNRMKKEFGSTCQSESRPKAARPKAARPKMVRRKAPKPLLLQTDSVTGDFLRKVPRASVLSRSLSGLRSEVDEERVDERQKKPRPKAVRPKSVVRRKALPRLPLRAGSTADDVLMKAPCSSASLVAMNEEDVNMCRKESHPKAPRPKAPRPKVARRKALTQSAPQTDSALDDHVPKALRSPASSKSTAGSRGRMQDEDVGKCRKKSCPKAARPKAPRPKVVRRKALTQAPPLMDSVVDDQVPDALRLPVSSMSAAGSQGSLRNEKGEDNCKKKSRPKMARPTAPCPKVLQRKAPTRMPRYAGSAWDMVLPKASTSTASSRSTLSDHNKCRDASRPRAPRPKVARRKASKHVPPKTDSVSGGYLPKASRSSATSTPIAVSERKMQNEVGEQKMQETAARAKYEDLFIPNPKAPRRRRDSKSVTSGKSAATAVTERNDNVTPTSKAPSRAGNAHSVSSQKSAASARAYDDGFTPNPKAPRPARYAKSVTSPKSATSRWSTCALSSAPSASKESSNAREQRAVADIERNVLSFLDRHGRSAELERILRTRIPLSVLERVVDEKHDLLKLGVGRSTPDDVLSKLGPYVNTEPREGSQNIDALLSPRCNSRLSSKPPPLAPLDSSSRRNTQACSSVHLNGAGNDNSLAEPSNSDRSEGTNIANLGGSLPVISDMKALDGDAAAPQLGGCDRTEGANNADRSVSPPVVSDTEEHDNDTGKPQRSAVDGTESANNADPSVNIPSGPDAKERKEGDDDTAEPQPVATSATDAMTDACSSAAIVTDANPVAAMERTNDPHGGDTNNTGLFVDATAPSHPLPATAKTHAAVPILPTTTAKGPKRTKKSTRADTKKAAPKGRPRKKRVLESSSDMAASKDEPQRDTQLTPTTVPAALTEPPSRETPLFAVPISGMCNAPRALPPLTVPPTVPPASTDALVYRGYKGGSLRSLAAPPQGAEPDDGMVEGDEHAKDSTLRRKNLEPPAPVTRAAHSDSHSDDGDSESDTHHGSKSDDADGSKADGTEKSQEKFINPPHPGGQESSPSSRGDGRKDGTRESSQWTHGHDEDCGRNQDVSPSRQKRAWDLPLSPQRQDDDCDRAHDSSRSIHEHSDDSEDSHQDSPRSTHEHYRDDDHGGVAIRASSPSTPCGQSNKRAPNDSWDRQKQSPTVREQRRSRTPSLHEPRAGSREPSSADTKCRSPLERRRARSNSRGQSSSRKRRRTRRTSSPDLNDAGPGSLENLSAQEETHDSVSDYMNYIDC